MTWHILDLSGRNQEKIGFWEKLRTSRFPSEISWPLFTWGVLSTWYDCKQWLPKQKLPQLLRIKVFVNCEKDKKILTHIQRKLTSYLGISLVRCYTQIREQMLGGTFLWFWAVGCGLGWGIKGLGRLWATFEGDFFNFLWAKIIFFWKHCSVRTEKLHRKKLKKTSVLLSVY